MRTAHKCRIYPTPEQVAVLNRTFAGVRKVWNNTLAWRHAQYYGEGLKTTFPETNAYLTAMKRESDLAWLGEVSSVPLQQALRHQYTAFVNFFAGRARYPRFKSWRGRQSAEYTRSAFRMRDGKLFLAKVDTPIAFVWTWPDIDVATLNPTTVTISRDPDGRWFASFALDVADPAQLAATGSVIGVDLGITDFAVTSNGDRIANPKHMERRERRLKFYQRRMARKAKGSKNKDRARVKVARAHSRVADARRDFLHQESTRLVRANDVIIIEDLAVKNMVGNRSLAKSISRCGWGEFRSMLTYKADKWSRLVIVIDRWYPSSKTCSSCRHLLAELSLGTRMWQCPSCGTRHDRDINAAKNILAAGLAVAGMSTTPVNACGAGVRPQGTPLRQSARKQESLVATRGIPVLQGWD